MVSGKCTHAKALLVCLVFIASVVAFSASCPAVRAHRDQFDQLLSGIRKRKLADCMNGGDSIIHIKCEELDEDESDDESKDPDFLPGKRMRT